MYTPLMEILMALPVFALVLFRLGGVVMTAPIVSSPAIPIRIRAAFVFTLAAMIFPLIKSQAPRDLSLITIVTAGLGELFIGVTIGVCVTILVSSAEIAGMSIAQQAGLALGEVFNPTYDDQSSVLGQMYGIVFTTILLLAGGLREMVAALLDSYQVMPLLSQTPKESYLMLLVEMTTAAFVLGIRLAAPVLIALILTTVILGIVSRAMPQLHILAVGFTFKVLATMALIALSLAACKGIVLDAIWAAFELIRTGLGLDPQPRGLTI